MQIASVLLQSWKSNCYSGNTTGCNDTSWTIFDPAPGPAEGPIGPNGNLRAERERVLSRVHMRGVVGPASSYFFNTSDQTFYLHVGVAAVAVASAPPLSDHDRVELDSVLAGLTNTQGLDASTITPAGTRLVSLTTSVPGSAVAAIEHAIASNGSLTQIYIPRGVAWNLTVTGAAVLSQVITWPDGSRSALILPSLPLRAYTVAVGPPGWVPPPPQAAEAAPGWDVAQVVEAAKAALAKSGALRHGTEWCAQPPSDWATVKARLDALAARDPDAALVRLLRAARSAGGQRGARFAALEADPVAALVTYATAVAQLRDAACGYAL